jgi:hypothetical protein
LCSPTLSNLIIYKTQFFFSCLSLDKKRSGKLDFSLSLSQIFSTKLNSFSFFWYKNKICYAVFAAAAAACSNFYYTCCHYFTPILQTHN